ncbi:MAG: PKD domain-containing protein [Saprospiraceae bacterium]
MEVSNGVTTQTTNQTVVVSAPPVPAFSFEGDQLTVAFFNTSTNAETYNWNFGDGTFSNETNPVHTYTEPGVYEVSLSASNTNCGIAISQSVAVSFTDTDTATPADDLYLYPNPGTGIIHFNLPVDGHWWVLDALGHRVAAFQLPAGTTRLDVSALPAGIYFILTDKAQRWVYVKV